MRTALSRRWPSMDRWRWRSMYLQTFVSIRTGCMIASMPRRTRRCGHFGNDGCGGGWPSTAMEYVHYVGGIVTEDSHKCTTKDENCRAKKKIGQNNVGAKIRRLHKITSFDENDLVKAVAHIGPVAVAFDVASGFHLYSHDAYDATTGDNLCPTAAPWWDSGPSSCSCLSLFPFWLLLLVELPRRGRPSGPAAVVAARRWRRT
mmetsp:Transcript_14930/g.43108  ORF Transcript_14930/g.43108 Transcript_14930/m.43108 type:complete len:203 (+) Transcript_14930:792-1400(+)